MSAVSTALPSCEYGFITTCFKVINWVWLVFMGKIDIVLDRGSVGLPIRADEGVFYKALVK